MGLYRFDIDIAESLDAVKRGEFAYMTVSIIVEAETVAEAHMIALQMASRHGELTASYYCY